MKIYLECFFCGEKYYVQNSTATEKSMFCTSDCEARENASLSQENQSIDEKLKANPAAFVKSLPTNLGANSVTQSIEAEPSEVRSILDGVFKNMRGN